MKEVLCWIEDNVAEGEGRFRYHREIDSGDEYWYLEITGVLPRDASRLDMQDAVRNLPAVRDSGVHVVLRSMGRSA